MNSDPIGITRDEFFGLNYYRYGEAYFGSSRGMRYRLAADPLNRLKPGQQPDGLELMATVWPEPFAYGKADPEEMTSEKFPFSEEGLNEAVKWIQTRYDTDAERWRKALEQPLV